MKELTSYKYIIAGAGLFGATVAERLASQGHQVLVIDRRNHLAGNVYSYTDPATKIEVHKYGSHIFHTELDEVWNYITSKSKEWFYIDNPHIGPLQFCQRNSNKKSKRYEFERLRVCFWWPRFVADLKFMHKYYVDWHRKK